METLIATVFYLLFGRPPDDDEEDDEDVDED